MTVDFARTLTRAAALTGQTVQPDRLSGWLARAGEATLPPAERLTRAWAALGLHGTPTPLAEPGPGHVPLIACHPEHGVVFLTTRHADGRWHAERERAEGGVESLTLDGLAGWVCLKLPPRLKKPQGPSQAFQRVREAVWAHRRVFIDALLATAVVNLLTLAGSLYSMQVYDRVIPNHGFQTLWVLTVGVGVAIALELLLKNARSALVDRACQRIDHQLSDWFMGRTLSIRMDTRPATVGTLASQVKGFEHVRGVLTSTSLFVLADVPFALFFIGVIAMIGGVLVLVPLVALPLALGAGLMFHRAIERHTREAVTGANKKAGLLVESIDGAESLKACSGEWRMQTRWNQLMDDLSDSERRMRALTAQSQHLTVCLQQVGYALMVAFGAWLVTENTLTMGALLACSIVSNRAMTPIMQLPALMAQWAHAKAALEGLDQLIALPSEQDAVEAALVPGQLSPGVSFERVRFHYGQPDQPVLELENLVIRPGERVALAGAIGSGKSTLLKLASGLYRPGEGKVLLGGVDMALLAPQAVRERVGYLPQEVRLMSGTLRDNLLLGLPDPGDEALLAAARKTGLIELIMRQKKGLALDITEGGRGVSGGQKQLIALTRLLLARPTVWLLDEPTGAMDAATEARFTSLLRDTLTDQHTLIVATHKTALLPLVDRLVLLKNGRLVHDGPRDDVLAKLTPRPAAVNA